MLARNALIRGPLLRTNAPRVTNVRYFRKTAPTKLTENKGFASILEAENTATGLKLYHATSVGLLALVPAAFVLSPSALSVPVDYALGVLIPLHSHIGMNNVISDYVPKSQQTLARLAWLGVTGVVFLGILRSNIEGPGLTETIKTIWRENPNKKQE